MLKIYHRFIPLDDIYPTSADAALHLLENRVYLSNRGLNSRPQRSETLIRFIREYKTNKTVTAFAPPKTLRQLGAGKTVINQFRTRFASAQVVRTRRTNVI